MQCGATQAALSRASGPENLHSTYAPELHFAGAALGGLVPNGLHALTSTNGGPDSGLIPRLLLGLTVQYPDVRKFLLSKLQSTNGSEFLAAQNLTLMQSPTRYAFVDIFSFFVDGARDFQDPQVVNLFNKEFLMGNHGRPRMPLFVLQGNTGRGVADRRYRRSCRAILCGWPRYHISKKHCRGSCH